MSLNGKTRQLQTGGQELTELLPATSAFNYSTPRDHRKASTDLLRQVQREAALLVIRHPDEEVRKKNLRVFATCQQEIDHRLAYENRDSQKRSEDGNESG